MVVTIEGFQLSPQQKYLWQLQQSGSFVYSAVCAVSITGNLQREVLEAAVNRVVEQHEILRTNYRYVPGMSLPLQFIEKRGCVWQNYNFINCAASEQTANLANLFNQLRHQQFDVEYGDNLYLFLVTLSQQKHILLIALPAVCADRATLNSLVKEISHSYAATQNKLALDNEQIQYADIAAWQNELLIAQETKTGRDYWHQLDLSNLVALQLPYENKTATDLEFNPQSYTLNLNAELTKKITNFTELHNISLSDFLLTCWHILLWRLTGQQNLIMGVTTDGRKYQELSSALGLLSKSLPITVYLKEESTFIQLWQEINNNLTAAYAYEDYFQLETNSSVKIITLPLCFEFTAQLPKYDAAGICFEIYQQYVCTDRYKIKLIGSLHDHALNLEIAYNANLFLADDMQRLAGQLHTLIDSVITTPDCAIARLNILSEVEKQQLIGFNYHQQSDHNQCIHQLFEKQVAINPHKVAVVLEHEKLTYAELNSRANQLARYLQQLGIGAEVLVGICVERTSPFMVLGILAILKAGGAFVPLDPTYPQERLAFMLESQPRVLLTQEHLSFKLPEHKAQVVYVEQVWQILAQLSAANLENAIATSLAYVIYTSGSTGKPKGVRVTHANLSHYVQAMSTALGITADDVYLHTASIAFSSAVRQLMLPLSQGASVKIATNDQRQDPIALFTGIKQDQVTIIDLVPTYWRNCIHILNSLASEVRTTLLDNNLRLIVSASEPLLSDIPASWNDLKHNVRLINMFGQTETCGIVAVNPITVEPDAETRVIPLGKPITNTQIYLLDKYLQPVPIGVPGELYIGGWGVGQGYLHRPDLTAEKFIPHPFSIEPGARLYKTGDLGRYLPDGLIEFIGRSDYQVKIRGFRIELAEIEAVLTQHPQVREAVVIAREDATGNQRLVAYVVSSETSQSELSSFLQTKLPDYMLPAAFVILDALPLTPNGKLNRQALPAPEAVQPKHTWIAPRTPVEEVLAAIWGKILDVAQVGIDDNFFALGGHSLLATQVMSQIREAFQVELPLRSLFESPTLAELAKQIAAILSDGQQLTTLPIKRVSRDRIPLSFAQQRLWFLNQLQPESTAYNLFRAIRLEGKLNVAALAQSFNAIIRRHEILRTSFQAEDGQPLQVIADLEIKLPIVDLSNLPPETRVAETQRWAKIQAQRAFDLTTLPLLDVMLLQLAPQEYVLLVTIHHIVADGWSAGAIARELAAFYESFCTGKPCVLPELPIQYADFAVWQRQWLQQQVLAAQMEYWKQQLSGIPVLELPIAKPRSENQTTGKKQLFELSPTLTAALKALSQSEGVTLFMTLLAAFQTLLYRYTAQEDILVGSPIANRNRSEIEGLIGFFVNTLVLRTYLGGNPSFQDLLKRVREVTLGAYTHQDLPFEVLVEELQPQRNLSHTPLFQVMFALQTSTAALNLFELNVNYLQVESDTARFDLSLALTDSTEGLIGELEYNSDLFDRDQITQMLEHLRTLLESIVAHPEKCISELPMLTQTEQQLLIEGNNTQANYPDVCVHQLFATQVEQTPDAVAVVCGEQQLTYRQLDFKANQLAQYLRSLGVGADVLVGICCDRTLEMIVGLLGILKAGGAYVPLDPTYPQQRLALILAESQISILLTQQHLLNVLPPHSAQIVCLDREWDIPDHVQTAYNVQPENLIYTIYTSGSTGKPKGVQITHRSVVNFLTAMQQHLQLTNQDTLLAVTTLSFDIAVLELFLPLSVGAKVILVSREVASDGTKLLQHLNSSDATIMQATPATWRMLLAVGWKGSPQLKILCGGEALPHNLAAQLRHNSAMVWNLYGPTETTIWSTIHQIDDKDASVPIGRAIANTQIYILDKYLQPVPVGVPGELHIGGVGLARGYFNQPELTSNKFIPNPFAQPPHPTSELLYKTGDLARYLPNGEIEYLGRIDNQVKLRGFRIELGEIETVLEQYPAVRQSIVILREDIPGNQRLVAYLVANTDTEIISKIHQYLRQQLPEYMIPAAFVLLEAMPLTPNSKVDRRALPAPETAIEANRFVAPRNPIEEILAAIWTNVLGVPVGIHDNFFELGGHSLLATQVISRIRKTLNVDLPLQHLFKSPTIAELAQTIQPSDNKIATIERTMCDRLPLSFAQARLWLLEQLNLGNGIYNIPAAVRLVGCLNVTALQQSINEIIRRHQVLRTTFPVINGQPVQVIVPNVDLKLPVIDLHNLPPGEISTEEYQRSFDLTQAPLLRCTLLQLDAEEYIVLFTIHHIVCDGWSIGVLIRELAVLYEAFCNGKLSPLPELPIQYADFAVWQRQQLQGERLEALLSYWQQQLGNLPVLKLPTKRPRTAVKTNPGASQSFIIPAQLAAKLHSLSRQEGVTLFMTLLAGFQVLLQRYTHQDDIVIGTDVANRNQAEVELLIGFFVNLLVLRTDLSGNPTFRELLQRDRVCTLDALAHQDLPFDELVKALQPERNLSNIPQLFQVLFVLQNAPMPALKLPGINLNLLEVEPKVARFDLALFLTESERGIQGKWQYNADLFDADTITRFTTHWLTLLINIVTQPDARINALEMHTEAEKVEQTMQQKERKAFNRQKFLNIAPQAVNLSSTQLVKTDYLQAEQTFPLLIQPDATEVDLIGWAKNNQEYIESELVKHGAILFRNFSLNSVAEFENFAQTICPNLFSEYGDLPRAGEGGRVYSSTPYPADKAILFHNESSHLNCFPLKIWFFCVQPAIQGGETPIVDCRKAYQLLNPQLRDRLAKTQLMYVRHYTDGLDVSWQDFFQTTDKLEVETYCRQAEIEFEWCADNGLVTRQLRPAIAVHPKTGEPVFFNQIQLHHIAYLDAEVRESLLSIFGEQKLPRHVYYGDGTPIEDAIIAEINQVYQQSQFSFTWQKGDILMLDNMLAAHGRNPYVGQRKIVVAMGEMIYSADINK